MSEQSCELLSLKESLKASTDLEALKNSSVKPAVSNLTFDRA